jgi:hypothetical protein
MTVEVDQLAHDAASYSKTYNLSPDETKTLELASQEAARDQYARAARESYRQYSGRTGTPDPFLPTITSLSPNTAVHGAAALTLTVNGTKFTEDSVITWGGADKPTKYLSATQLTFDVPATLLQSAATVPVKVRTDSSLSGSSNFTIT